MPRKKRDIRRDLRKLGFHESAAKAIILSFAIQICPTTSRWMDEMEPTPSDMTPSDMMNATCAGPNRT